MESQVDPTVCRAKFDREVAAYKSLHAQYIERGWWLLKADYPEVLAVLATPKLKPPCVVFGVQFDFTDYDFQPASVRLVNPFTRVPYKYNELPSQLNRSVMQPGPGGVTVLATQPLMQPSLGDRPPFLCIPGVREYHSHPAHSGDPWELRRQAGEGGLFFLMDQLWKYGVEPILQFHLEFRLNINGFALGPPPS